MMEKLLTLKEIAAEIGVPESNLRYYRNRISEFLPSSGRGRRRRYYADAVGVFQKTVTWLQEGMTLDRVYGLLAADGPHEEIAPAQAGGMTLDNISEAIRTAISLMPLPAPSAPSPALPAELMDGIRGLESRLKEWHETGLEQAQTAAAQVAELQQKTVELECDLALIREREQRKESDLQCLREEYGLLKETLQEKDRIIEEQRTRLLEIRSLRNTFLEEVQKLRLSIQPRTGPGAG